MRRRFVITDHALSRFVERHPALYEVEFDETRRMLLEELDDGIPYGYQKGRDELYLLPSGLAAAVSWVEGVGIVKTVLTKNHAIAGMESQGALLRRAEDLPDPLLEASMRMLAEKHLSEGLGKKLRNALLREAGYDPTGHAGDLYRAAIKAARAAADRNGSPKKTSGTEASR